MFRPLQPDFSIRTFHEWRLRSPWFATDREPSRTQQRWAGGR